MLGNVLCVGENMRGCFQKEKAKGNFNKIQNFCFRSRKTHPGSVIHLSDNPQDPSKLLIGYETGQVVLWDMRTKVADMRWNATEPLRSISWHHEGKQFICSHTDGSLTTWNVRQGPKPANVTFPHGECDFRGFLRLASSLWEHRETRPNIWDSFRFFSFFPVKT